jgi:hypothetical protein
MKVRLITAFTVAVLCLAFIPQAGASVITVDFDNVAACCAANLSNSSGAAPSPWLTFGVMRIDGGMVVADPNATSAPNVYAAFSAAPPSSTSVGHSGSIEMMFSSAVSNLGFDVINGGMASAGFMAFAFDPNGKQLGVDMLKLNCSSCVGDVGHVSFNFGDIGKVIVVGGPAAAVFSDFAVDTVKFTAPTAVAPEPASLALLGSGIIALCGMRKRFSNR